MEWCQSFPPCYLFNQFQIRYLSVVQLLCCPVIIQIPIKWPKSRDEVWKANIPHTHLAHEKSDQNWMVVKGDKIAFPGGGTHFHYGADKYIASIANVRLLTLANLAEVKNTEPVYLILKPLLDHFLMHILYFLLYIVY